jgi:hypothetical protein
MLLIAARGGGGVWGECVNERKMALELVFLIYQRLEIFYNCHLRMLILPSFKIIKALSHIWPLRSARFNGIVQPFELKCVTRLIRSAVKNWRSGNFFKSLLMAQSHGRCIKPFTAA